MLRTWFKDLQIEHKKLRFIHSRIFNFTFIIELWAKMSLLKHKSHYYTTVQMVCWLRSVPCVLRDQASSNPAWANFTFFLNCFTENWYSEHLSTCFWTIYVVFLCDLRWKLWQNNTEVSFRHSRSVYITANSTVHSTLTILKPDNQWLCYTTKEHHFFLQISVYTCGKDEIGVLLSILILVLCMYTATYNANTNSYRQTSNLLRMQLVYLWKSGEKTNSQFLTTLWLAKPHWYVLLSTVLIHIWAVHAYTNQ